MLAARLPNLHHAMQAIRLQFHQYCESGFTCINEGTITEDKFLTGVSAPNSASVHAYNNKAMVQTCVVTLVTESLYRKFHKIWIGSIQANFKQGHLCLHQNCHVFHAVLTF